MFTIQTTVECTRLRFSIESRYLLVGDGCEVWELPPGQSPTYLDDVPCGVEWHPCKAELYVPRQNSLEILTPSGKRLQSLRKTGWFRGQCFSPAGDWLVTFEPYSLTGWKRVRDRWQLKWSEKVTKAKWYSPGDSFESVVSLPNNRTIVALVRRTLPFPKKGERQGAHGGYAELLVQRDLATGRVLGERVLPDKEAPAQLIVTPDGSAVIGFRGRSVYVWPTDFTDAKSRKVTVAKKDVRGVALHPSGQWLLTVCGNSEVSVWDTRTWKAARTYDWGIDRLECAAVSPDGSLAAVGEGTEVAVWDWDL